MIEPNFLSLLLHGLTKSLKREQMDMDTQYFRHAVYVTCKMIQYFFKISIKFSLVESIHGFFFCKLVCEYLIRNDKKIKSTTIAS